MIQKPARFTGGLFCWSPAKDEDSRNAIELR